MEARSKEELVVLGFAEENDEIGWSDVGEDPSICSGTIGGRPIWLKNSVSFQNTQKLKLFCKVCSNPLSFLLQIYAPLEGKLDCFHRVLYIFCCRRGECHRFNTFFSLRCQLDEASFSSFSSLSPHSFSPLCRVCGLNATKKCGRCKNARYCSSFHQKVDWSLHKPICGKKNHPPNDLLFGPHEDYPKILFPFYEIVTEEEGGLSLDKDGDDDESEAGFGGSLSDIPDKEWDSVIAETSSALNTRKLPNGATLRRENDPAFSKFINRISDRPDQVLRYYYRPSADGINEPLWISEEGQLDQSEVPDCPYCGSKRILELQILPQLLSFLKTEELGAESIDWGVVNLYTCANSCSCEDCNEEQHEDWMDKDSNNRNPIDVNIDIESQKKEIVESEESFMNRSLKIGAAVSAYWVISISMVFLNKYLLSGINLNAPIFVTWYQCVVASVFCLSMGFLNSGPQSLFSIFPPPEFDISRVKASFPLSTVFIGMILFNNLCLKFLGVAFYNVGRSLTTVFNVLFTFILLGQRTSPKALLCCGILVLGFMLGVDQESGPTGTEGVSWLGIIFGVAASLCVSLNAIYVKKVLPVMENNEWRLTFYNNVNATLIGIPIMFFLGEFEEVLGFESLFKVRFWFLMTACGILGVAIAIATVLQIKMTSPLTHNVSGTAKACAQTVIAVAHFQEIKSVLWWVSNIMVLGGSLAYTHVRRSEMKR